MQQHLEDALRERFYAVNGRHDMTRADDLYVDEHFVSLDAAETHGFGVDGLARLMLAGRLPLPTYLRSDGRFMIAADLLGLADEAGGVEQLPGWFGGHFSDGSAAAAEWSSYLSGRYFACLRSVSPATIRRKDELIGAIEGMLAAPREADPAWLVTLHRHVDELDRLERPFAPYDRRRFGSPTSRDRYITHVRHAHPPPAVTRHGASSHRVTVRDSRTSTHLSAPVRDRPRGGR